MLKIGGGGPNNNGFAYKGYEEQMDKFLEKEFRPGDVDKLITNGKLFTPKSTTLRKGRPNGCHGNVARLVSRYPQKYTAWTGMSLGPDPIWRSHSWAINKNGDVIETTVPRTAYYGYQMDEAMVGLLSKGW